MLEYIKKIPFMQSSIANDDMEKVIFPIIIEELYDIKLVNLGSKQEISFKDDTLASVQNVKANKNDIIYISFAVKTPHISILLKIRNIFQYSCGINDIMKIRAYRGEFNYDFGGVRINIMDRNDYISDINPAKLFIDIQLDIIAIEANEIEIMDAKYIV